MNNRTEEEILFFKRAAGFFLLTGCCGSWLAAGTVGLGIFLTVAACIGPLMLFAIATL